MLKKVFILGTCIHTLLLVAFGFWIQGEFRKSKDQWIDALNETEQRLLRELKKRSTPEKSMDLSPMLEQMNRIEATLSRPPLEISKSENPKQDFPKSIWDRLRQWVQIRPTTPLG